MKIYRTFIFVSAITVSQFALAKLPMSNDVFGKSEGTLDFCAQAKPQDAGKYQERKKSLVRGIPEKEVADARQTQDYKNAYEWITGELGKVPKDQTAAACGAVLQNTK